LISSSTGTIPNWQQQDLAAGSPSPSTYFQNPTATYVASMVTAAGILFTAANTANDFVTAANATSLIVELSSFKSHTDNISGVVVVTDQTFPSLQSAQNIGQLNMMTLSKTDGIANTTPILGSYTSLFIQDELSANANQILTYATQYQNSLVANTLGGHPNSNLSPTQIATIQSYVTGTQSLLSTRRTSDWSFYRNSVQLAKDVGYMSQFNNMGGTMSYLVNNVVGTPALITKLSSS
jgi:hypothetical protein